MIFDDSSNSNKDPLYIKVRDEYKRLSEWIEKNYNKNLNLLEKDAFKQRIKQQFSAGFAELYTISTLSSRLKLNLVFPDKKEDLDVWIPNDKIRIEITALTSGENGFDNSIPNFPISDYENGFQIANNNVIDKLKASGHDVSEYIPDISSKLVLRINSSLTTKFEHIQKKIDDPSLNSLSTSQSYIVVIYAGCLNLYARDVTRAHPLLEVLFAIGREKIKIDRQNLELSQLFRGSIPSNTKTTKEGDIEIPNGLFLDNKHKHISGVIYCSRSPLSIEENHPLDEELGKDFIFAHNPYASSPVRYGYIECGTEYICKLKSKSEINIETIDYEPDCEAGVICVDF